MSISFCFPSRSFARPSLFALCLAVSVTAFGPTRAQAQPVLLQSTATAKPGNAVSIHMDPANTTVTFTAGTFKHVKGSFALKGGLFAFDGASGVAQGEILVDAESEKSNDASLDRKIRTQTLEVAKYPGISFHPEDVIGTLPPKDGVYHFKLKGSLTIHGTDHTVTADVDATQNGDQVLLKSTFTVPYVEWGMKDAGTFLMRDRNIRVTIESHGVVERGDAKATPAS
jgi:polyisoprenoid-binding protein YceI